MSGKKSFRVVTQVFAGGMEPMIRTNKDARSGV